MPGKVVDGGEVLEGEEGQTWCACTLDVLEGLVEDSLVSDKGGRRRVPCGRSLGKGRLGVEVGQGTQVLGQGEIGQRRRVKGAPGFREVSRIH
eukprot:566761-Pleurochrysis_carterae.AAC.1